MTTKNALQSGILIGVSAVLYCLCYVFQDWLFHFAQHISGVHWFYLPSGLRVLLVLVAGIHGAMGIVAASVWINVHHLQDLQGALLWLTAAASGFGAWAALWLLRVQGLISPTLAGLTSSGLLKFALLYSGLNALVHQTLWWVFGREGSLFWVDVWPMFVGDLLGAVVFLYGLKGILRLRKFKRCLLCA